LIGLHIESKFQKIFRCPNRFFLPLVVYRHTVLICKSQYLDVQKMENKNVQKIELRIRNI
jgi:hypothetical protein